MSDNTSDIAFKSRFAPIDFQRQSDLYNEIVAKAQELEYALEQLPVDTIRYASVDFHNPLAALENIVRAVRRGLFA